MLEESDDVFQVAMESAGNVGLALWLWLMLPVSFVLLPVSRRRARVRSAHLARVAAYGFVALAGGLAAALLLAGLGVALDADTPITAAGLLLRFGIPLGIVVWWAAAVRRYLRMPHSAVVAMLLSVVVGLLFVGGLWLAAPGFLVWWITPGL